MPLIARQRSRLAVLAVLALVGSLLAVSAVPAVAAGDKKASFTATYSACVGAAEDDAGLTDMDGHAFEAAANCLAHYDITKGTSEGVFSPNASVTRLQMALFLARAAGPAGIELLDPAEDQGFGDIDGYTSEIQDAINQIAELEIMSGTDDDTFSPDGMVSRADMAVFLDAFVKAAPIGPGGLGGEISKYSDVKPDDEPFDDVGSVSFGAYGSIRRVYELGITTGTADSDGTKFAPDVMVTRGQMAAFITRALAHTNARPAGISAQSDMEETDTGPDGGFTLQISVRDDSHVPVVDTVVDHFSASSGDVAFDDDGLCNAVVTGGSDPAENSTRCEIDAGDEATDSDGNLEFDVDETDAYCAGNTKWIWAWTGDIGDKFDSDDTDAAMVGVGITKAKASIKHSSDAAAGTVEFGTTVTVTLQLVDNKDPKKGDPVAEEEVAIRVTTMETIGKNVATIPRGHETDASGRVELTYSYDDPDEDADSDEVTVMVTRDPIEGLDRDDQGDTPIDPVTVATITWSDDDSKPSNLALSQSTTYHMASEKGGGVRHTVTATLTDQYGDPVSGVRVYFWSDGINADYTSAGREDDPTDDDDEPFTENDGLGGAKGSVLVGSAGMNTWTPASDTDTSVDADEVNYSGTDNFAGFDKTNRKGVARKSYNRDSDVSMTEMIEALAVIGKRDGAMTEPDADDDDEKDRNIEIDDIRGDADADMAGVQMMMSHYWAEAIGSASTDNLEVVAIDTDANTIVAQDDDDNDKNLLAMYDSNDQFNASNGGVKMAIFEDALKVGHVLVIDMASDPEPGVNSLTNNGTTAVPVVVPADVTCHD